VKRDHATWRKGKNGEWLVFGPAYLLQSLGEVPVVRKDGKKERYRIFWTSKTFEVDGVPHCYGRPESKRKCDYCGQWHYRVEVQAIYAGGTMGTGASWYRDSDRCTCGGYLGEERL